MPEKNNGTLRMFISVFGPLVVLVGAAIGYGMLRGDVNYACSAVIDNANRLDDNTALDHRRDLELADLKKDLQYLKEAAANQKVDIANHTILLENILDKVTR